MSLKTHSLSLVSDHFASMAPVGGKASSYNGEWQRSLLKELIRNSFHCIAYLRHLFDEAHFADYRLQSDKDRYSTRSDVRIKRIKRGVSDEADCYMDWVDKGICDAIDSGELASIQLALYLEENEPGSAKETYLFHVDGASTEKLYEGPESNSGGHLEVISRQRMVRFIRSLILETQKMDPLPIRKFASVYLYFRDTQSMRSPPFAFIKSDRSRKPTVAILRSEIPSDSRFAFEGLGSVCVGLDILRGSEGDTDKVWIDPLGDNQGPDAFELEELKNTVDVPPSYDILSLSLGEFLERPRKTVCATQPLSSLEFGRHTPKSLECECGAQSFWAVTTLSCQICQRKLHSCCYGLSAAPVTLHCYSCIFGCVNSDLLKMMQLRYLWKLFMSSGIPHSTRLFHTFKSHSTSQYDDMKELLNILFSHRLLFVIEESLSKVCAQYTTGTGELNPPIDGIMDQNECYLTKHKHYPIAFAPRLNNLTGYKYDSSLQKRYFPVYSNDSAILLNQLMDFSNYQTSEKGATRKSAETTDPIESSSCHSYNKGQMGYGFHSTILKDVRNPSFEDSLHFLSQSQTKLARYE